MRITPYFLKNGHIAAGVGLVILGLFTLTVRVVPAQAYDACASPQFGASRIMVDEHAETAEDAQINGMRRATEMAFARVLSRLLRDPAIVDAFVEAHQPDRFVDFFHIASENTLAGRYIATLDYCFVAGALRDAFRTSGFVWAELGSPRILVLPVWLAPDGARAWQRDNEWLTGWRQAVAAADGLVDFILLEPTILNERSLRAADLALADPVVLRRAATVAGADQIMLVTARLDYRGSQQILAVDGQLFTANAAQMTVLGKMVDTAVSDDLSTQLNVARQTILQELESGWHAANIIRGDNTRSLTVSVPVASLAQWVDRLAAFDSLAVIDSYVVHKLDISGGLVTLTVVGDNAAVENGLAAERLRLRQRDDGGIVLEPR